MMVRFVQGLCEIPHAESLFLFHYLPLAVTQSEFLKQ